MVGQDVGFGWLGSTWISFQGYENVLELDSGDGHTSLLIY